MALDLIVVILIFPFSDLKFTPLILRCVRLNTNKPDLVWRWRSKCIARRYGKNNLIWIYQVLPFFYCIIAYPCQSTKTVLNRDGLGHRFIYEAR